MTGTGSVPSGPGGEMRSALPAAVAQILAAEGGVAGAGFLAAEDTLITCAHVVRDAGSGPGGQVELAFPHAPGTPRRFGRVLDGQWRAPEAEDVAFVQVSGGAPTEARTVALGSAAESQGHAVRAFGFPMHAPPGGHFGYGVAGDLLPTTAGTGAVLQLTGANDLTRGFSGGPVADEVTGLVVGMVTAFTTPDEHLRGQGIAYATPTEELREVRPELVERQVSPYRGLEPFTAEHAEWFHGRDAAIEKVLAALRRQRRALLLLGPSGAGKSSLIQAGVLPALAAGALPGSDHWLPVLARPGQDLLTELDHAGMPGAVSDGIAEAAEQALAAECPRSHLLLIIDQLEELLTPPAATQKLSDVQLAAVEELVAAIGSRTTLSVVLVMRDDFYPRLAALAPTLLEVLEAQGGTVNVPNTLSVPELRAIIVEPALSAGARFQDGLPDRIINDVLANELTDTLARRAPVTSLPPLELALSQLWDDRRDGFLTHEAYQRIGEVTGALATWCDTALGQVPADQRPVAQRILTALVRPADPTHSVPATRQQVRLADLHALAATGTAADHHTGGGVTGEVLAALTRHRIITTGTADIPGWPDDAPREPVAELIHDALIRDWPDLRAWVAEDHRFHDWLRRAGERRARWADSSHPGDLLRGSDLAEGLDWSRQRGLPGDVAAFLHASEEAEHAERERERRRTRRLQQLLAGVAVALCLALIAAGLAFWQRQTAVSRQRMVQSGRLVIQSTALLDTDPDLASLLAIHAYETNPTAEATLNLFAAAALPLRQRLTGHSEVVRSAAFSPDGKTLATGSDDHTVRLWDVASGRTRATLKHRDGVTSVAFSPDGKTLATSWGDRVDLWDTTSGRTRATLKHPDSVLSVAFSPDGRTLAAGVYDDSVRLWDVATHRSLASLTGHTRSVESVAFSPDGKTLASSGLDYTLRLWDVASRRTRVSFYQPYGMPSVTFSPNSKTLVTGMGNGVVQLRDVSSGRIRSTFTGHTSSVESVAFSPDGKTLATGSEDSTVWLRDAASGNTRATLHSPAAVTSLAFSPDGRTLGTGGVDASVRLWDVATERAKASLTGLTEDVESVAFSPDGRTLAAGGEDPAARLWDVATHRVRATLAYHTISLESLAFSPDGKTLATGGLGDGKNPFASTVLLWDVASGRARATLTSQPGVVRSVAFSPDGKTLAIGSAGGLRLRDVASGRTRVVPTDPDHSVESVAFSPDGRTLATGSGGGAVGLWDVASGRVRATLTGHTDLVTTMAFSPDGTVLATGGWDDTVRLWDVATGDTRATLTGHTQDVESVDFSPDGRTLATGGADGAVRFWDVASGRTRAILATNTNGVLSVAFSPDGKTLATGSRGEGTVRLWDVDLPDQAEAIKKICRVVQRDLTRQERSVYFPGHSPDPACSSQ
ncbi:trypsin-like peptidase domain-containing protein [Streptomyces sp. NPDC005820]|uniref:nSTAND1 domain-containing NTPase n=1 Tax=Streptomyces sp. NPDC005820 TaxID=3157069 RepID=UPI0033E6A7ED